MLTRKSSYGKIREYQITREKTYKISNNLTTKYYKHRDYQFFILAQNRARKNFKNFKKYVDKSLTRW